MKDVGEYVDNAERMWRHLGLQAEQLGTAPAFEYVKRTGWPAFAVGHLSFRLTFPGHPSAYLKIDEWLVSDEKRIQREAYVYELVFEGGVLQNWHRHRDRHGGDHQHVGSGVDERRMPARTSLKSAVQACMRILWEGIVPEGSGDV